MEPFGSYLPGLREHPGCLGGGSCRTGYGLDLQRITRQTTCAYCGMSMVDTYEHSLLMSVDHVIPGCMRKREGWQEWVDNANNLVLCCSAQRFPERLPHAQGCPRANELRGVRGTARREPCGILRSPMFYWRVR